MANEKPAEVITLGEPMAVLIAEEMGELKDVSRFTRGIAGAELNVAISLTRLGHRCKYITKLGEDPFGEYIYDYIKSTTIDYGNISFTEEQKTGSYLKSKPLTGEDPIVHYYRKNSAAAHMSVNDIENIEFRGAKILHITGITPALSESCREAVYYAIEKARKESMTITFDTNIRKPLWASETEMREVLNDIAFKSDIVLPGIGEGVLLTDKDTPEEIADFYIKNGSKSVVVKTGKSGAYYQSRDNFGQVPGFKVANVVDTVGAGDGFASGLLSGLLQEKTLEEAVRIGNAIASIIIQYKGDNAPLPRREELEEYIEKNYS